MHLVCLIPYGFKAAARHFTLRVPVLVKSSKFRNGEPAQYLYE